ncbi:MAG: hypothetical protein GEV07_11010 [Streptosporangiales bacterium]|nr:hypothetical protein [Streptosporangiales bacterium]
MSDPDPRIESMLNRDLVSAVIFTVAMWLVLVFTYLMVVSIAPGALLRIVLGVAMLALGGFNTASMVALIQRYRQHRNVIYTEDLRHLDMGRAAKAGKS